MSEEKELELQDNHTHEPIAETAFVHTEAVRGYTNKTARTLNMVHFVLLIATAVYGGFQVYLNVQAYLQQMAPMSIAILYTVATVLMPLVLMFAGSYLFKFFAEVVELMDRKQK